jgi:hypothetical protein
MGTAFTYQGRLIDANKPADGLYDLQCKLYDANVGGTQKGSTIDVNELDVIDGLFTVLLDFGSGVFDGNTVWLEIGVRAGELKDPNTYTTLSPRQEITPTPYSLYSLGGGGVGGSLWQVNDTSIYYNNGNVGIGTTSPTNKLDVSGDVTAAGRVGIGTTSPRVATEIYGSGYVGLMLAKRTDYDISGVLYFESASNFQMIRNRAGALVFETDTAYTGAGTERMRITSGGNVGIGTTTPEEKLTVAGGTIKSSTSEATGKGVVGVASYTGNGTNYGGYFEARGTGGAGVYGFASHTSGTNYGVYGETKSPNGYAGYFIGGRNAFQGDVGIGCNDPGEKLDVAGTAKLRSMPTGTYATVSADTNGRLYKASSSQRYKTNIQVLDADTDAVLKLRPVRFQWKTTGQNDIGLIAEEVAQQLNDLVIYDNEGRPDAVKYDRVSLYLLGVVKDLKAENESLKQRLASLETVVQQLAKGKEFTQ